MLRPAPLLFLLLESLAQPQEPPERTYLAAAEATGRWLRAVAVETTDGLCWPPDPEQPQHEVEHLYSGSAGVVLFFSELAAVSSAEDWGALARAGADHLTASLPDQLAADQAGLYTGIAGIGFVLERTSRLTGSEQHRQGALRCLELLHRHAEATEHGARWNASTDVIQGSAGIGFFLLHSARELDRSQDLALAARAGAELARSGMAAEGGLKWAMDPQFPRLMPNFSHGTAGVASFLAALHRQTGDPAPLQAAIAGARYLQAVADTRDGGCRIFHHEPGGEDLYYLGWCHGPPGTARLFQHLELATGEPPWAEWVRRSARSVRRSGIRARRTPGFWNNVGQCCGSAGVIEFFLSLHHLTGDPEHLDFARELADDLLARATRDAGGWRWRQAEHRSQPDLLQAQTGYMQGAAGVGMALLHLDAALRGEHGWTRLPDNPFR